MSLRGFLMGAFGLIVLEVLVTGSVNGQGKPTGLASAFGGVFDTVAGLVSRFMDPNVPAIPDLRSDKERKAETAPPTPSTPQNPSGSNTTPPTAGGAVAPAPYVPSSPAAGITV